MNGEKAGVSVGIDEHVSLIEPRILAAFKETEYWVDGVMRLPLRIGAPHAELAALHAQRRVECSAYLTAANPFSQPLDDESNAQRMMQLAGELTRRDWVFVAAEARHPAKSWPPEACFLVFGPSRREAAAMGQRYQQNAVLWSGADAVPRLILLR